MNSLNQKTNQEIKKHHYKITSKKFKSDDFFSSNNELEKNKI